MSAHVGAAAAAAIAQAIKASGVIVRVSEEDFANILSKTERPLGKNFRFKIADLRFGES